MCWGRSSLITVACISFAPNRDLPQKQAIWLNCDRVLGQSKLRLLSKWCGQAWIHWNDCPYQSLSRKLTHHLLGSHADKFVEDILKNLCNVLCKCVTICLKNSNFTNQKWWVPLLEAFLTSFSFHLIWLQGYKVVSMWACKCRTYSNDSVSQQYKLCISEAHTAEI